MAGKASPEARAALREYLRACRQAKLLFSRELPDLLKFSPAKFWKMLQKPAKSAQNLDLQNFADFNTRLFADPIAAPEGFCELSDPSQSVIGADELEEVLVSCFKANKSSGLSPLPLQLLKHIGRAGIECLAHFFNVSAVF